MAMVSPGLPQQANTPSPFFWGGAGEKLTAAQVKQQREVADALVGRNSTIAQNPWEGLAQIANAYAAREWRSRADAGEQAGKDEVAALLAGVGPDTDFKTLMGIYGNDFATDADRQIASLLMQDDIAAMDPMHGLQMQNAELTNQKLAAEIAAATAPPAPKGPEFQGGQWWDINSPTPTALTQPAQDPTSAMQNFEYLKGIGVPEAEAREMAFGSGGVNVNVGPQGQEFAAPPFGQDYRRNPDGTVAVDPSTGMPEIVVIPNGPQATEAAAAEAAAATGNEMQGTYADVVKEDIGRALDLLETDPTFTTGMFGNVLGNWTGSNADRLDQFLNTVRSNVAFDRLQQMRDASPTGGALGSVTENELAMLQSAIGSLERSNPDDLAYNLKRVQEIYDRVMAKAAAYPNASQFGFTGPEQTGQGNQPNQANPPNQSQPPAFASQADYDAAPSGTVFKAPDGSIRVKP